MEETFREQFRRSGLSILALSEAAGVPYSALRRFLIGETGATLRTADKLASVLGLRLVTTKPRKGV